jgi:ribose 5-phosphate isomerase A
MTSGLADAGVQAAAARALQLVTAGMTVGLGTGRAAAAFIAELGARVAQGFAVAGVPTSDASTRQARALGIPLVDLENGLEEGVQLDLTVDGADEVTPNLDLVKGRGGALVKERIVAASSRRQIILIGAEKLVTGLGQRGGIPIEVIPLARGLVTHRLKALGLVPMVRLDASGARPFVTENGNLTIDVQVAAPLGDPAAARALDAAVRAIAGVVDTGLFLGTASQVLVGHPDGRVDVLSRPGS